MLGRVLLQISLLLWLTQQSSQGGVRPQTGGLGRLVPSRGAGILGGRGYGVTKPGKAGGGLYRPSGAGGRGGPGSLKQGYGTPAGYGAGLGPGLGNGAGGAGLGPGTGLGLANGLGLGTQLGKQAGRGYGGNGYGGLPGYGPGAGGYPGAGRGAPGGIYPSGKGSKPSKPGYGAAAGGPTGQGAKTTGNGPVGQLPAVQGGKRNGYGLGAKRPAGQGSKSTGLAPGAGLSSGQRAKGTGRSVPSRQGDTPSQTGYGPGLGRYPGAGLTNGYGTAYGPLGYPQVGRGGKLTGYGDGQGGYPDSGVSNGYGNGQRGPGVGAKAALAGAKSNGYTNGYGVGDGYGAGVPLVAAGSLPYGGQPVVPAGLGPLGKSDDNIAVPYAGQPVGLGPDTGLGGLGGGLEPVSGKYTGGAGQLPYNGAPVIPAGLEGDDGYPYSVQQLGLGVSKSAAKYGNGRGYAGAQPAGYGALGTGGVGTYGGGKEGSKYGLSGFYGNGYKG